MLRDSKSKSSRANIFGVGDAASMLLSDAEVDFGFSLWVALSDSAATLGVFASPDLSGPI